jgi:pSer/pThr/pTyr-binding forkhead associated (FHA) protein
VSRVHAHIRFQDNKFYITDEKSKFGTLIKLDHKVDLNR